MTRPIRIAFLWLGTVFAAITIATTATILLARLDWYFLRTFAYIGSPVVYVLVWMVTGRTPLYWAAVGLLKLEAHQQQAVEVCMEGVEEYKRRRPEMERKLRSELQRSDLQRS